MNLKLSRHRQLRHCEELLRRKQSRRPSLHWIASRSLSSGARSRDPVARNDVETTAKTSKFVIARSSCDEAIQFFSRSFWIASRALAMTWRVGSPNVESARRFGDGRSKLELPPCSIEAFAVKFECHNFARRKKCSKVYC